MSKYQVGDLVEITDKLYGHDFEIGELVEVVRYSLVSDDYLVKSANGAHFYVTDEEISDIKVDIERDQPDFDEPDMVNSPAHYGNGSIECIEYIEDFLTTEEFIGYLRGNIAKYLHRFRYKNGLEDLRKAEWYLNRLTEVMEDE
jgi:hypothetical protein